jgi:hypothetical protein
VEQVFDKADDGSVMIVRKYRGADLYDVVVFISDKSA